MTEMVVTLNKKTELEKVEEIPSEAGAKRKVVHNNGGETPKKSK